MEFILIVLYLVIGLVAGHIGIQLGRGTKPLKTLNNRHVVITGGSSGIGLWLAIHCAKLGAHVTIVARNVDNLKAAIGKIREHKIDESQKFEYVSLDLSTNYPAIESAFKDIESRISSIHMLMNCAGGAICGRVDEMPATDAVHMMNINYFAVYYPTRYVLEQMKKTGDGIIMITGSQASLAGIYGYGNYAAAKFALRGLAETIAMEVSNTGISITLALPADTDTPGFENENKTKPEETKIISGGGGLATPEIVAKKILRDSLNGTFISIYGIESWLLTLICSGMSPWNGFMFTAFQAIVAGPLRFVAFGLQWYFQSIVRSCGAKKALREIGVNTGN